MYAGVVHYLSFVFGVLPLFAVEPRVETMDIAEAEYEPRYRSNLYVPKEPVADTDEQTALPPVPPDAAFQANSASSTINTQSVEKQEIVKFDAQLLIWYTTEESLAYGVEVGPSATPTNQLTAGIDTSMTYVKPGMNVGSRISCIIPFRIPSNSWESGLTWTYYGNHQKTSINIPATPGVTVIRDSTHLTPIFTNMT